MARTLIYNVNIVNEGCVRYGYVLVDGELIAKVGEGEPN